MRDSPNHSLDSLVAFLLSSSMSEGDMGELFLVSFERSLRPLTDLGERLALCRSALSGARRVFEPGKGILDTEKLACLKEVGHSTTAQQMRTYYSLALKRIAKEFLKHALFQESRALFEEILQDCKEDPHGTRYYLVPLAIIEKHYDQATTLLNRFPGQSGPSLYNTALSALTRDPAAFETHAHAAAARNPHIAPLLLGRKRMPLKIQDDFDFKPGSSAEAAWYVHWIGPIWAQIPGALDQLLRLSPRLNKSSVRQRRASPAGVSSGDVRRFERAIAAADLFSRAQVLDLLISQSRFLFDRELWLLYQEQPVFARLDQNSKFVAHFSGALGNLKGANIYMDEPAYDMIISLSEDSLGITGGGAPDCEINQSLFAWSTEALWITIEELKSMPPMIQQELNHFIANSHRASLPVPQMKRRGFAPWQASDQELIVGLIGLLGLSILATTVPADDDRTIEVDVGSNPLLREPLLKALSAAAKHSGREHEVPGLGSSRHKLADAWKRARPSSVVWEVGFVGGLGVIQENQQQRPSMAGISLVVDAKSGIILGSEPLFAATPPARSLAKALIGVLQKTRTRPTGIRIHNSILSSGIPQEIGLPEVSIAEKTPAFTEAALGLLQQFGQHANALQ